MNKVVINTRVKIDGKKTFNFGSKQEARKFFEVNVYEISAIKIDGDKVKNCIKSLL